MITIRWNGSKAAEHQIRTNLPQDCRLFGATGELWVRHQGWGEYTKVEQGEDVVICQDEKGRILDIQVKRQPIPMVPRREEIPPVLAQPNGPHGDETDPNPIQREWFKIVPDEPEQACDDEACGVAPEEPQPTDPLIELGRREQELRKELMFVEHQQRRLRHERLMLLQQKADIASGRLHFGMDWGHPEGDYSVVQVTSKHKYYEAVLALLRQAEKEEKQGV